MLNKNEIIDLNITDITSEGAGVGRVDGIAVFVPFSAIDDHVRCRVEKIGKSFCYAKIVDIIRPSPDRIKPDCPVFYHCGGCAYRHLDYNAELKSKYNIVTAAFKRLGGFNIVPETVLPSPNISEYRNKAQFVVRQVEGVTKTGFFAPRSHRFIPIDECKLQPRIFQTVSKICCEYFDEHKISCYDETKNSGIVRHLLIRKSEHSGEIMVCVVVRKSVDLNMLGNKLQEAGVEQLTLIENINRNKTNVILGKENRIIIGKGYITERLFEDTEFQADYDIGPHSFFQVNTKGAHQLYRVARDFADIKPSDSVLDLYCGVGSIGMSICSKNQKIVGVDIVPSAIDSANATAKRAGFINAEFVCGDAHTGLLTEHVFDIVVVDPPRKGLDGKTIELLLKTGPGKIVMVSCNPSTAARDASLLKDQYKIEKLVAVDMFARCAHVEAVVLLSKIAE